MSSATEIREKRRKKELETSNTKSITDVFSAQHNRNRLHCSAPLPTPLLPLSLLESLPHQVIKKVETKFELQT